MSYTFRTSFRGYEPADVEEALAQHEKAVAEANAEAARLTVELTKARESEAVLREAHAASTGRVTELEEQMRTTPAPSYSELGARIGQMLGLAQEEATALRADARAEAEATVLDSRAQADRAQARADEYVVEVRSQADADSARLLEQARAHADAIVDAADREATARREEAEAVYEHQRAQATAAAADFEQTLATRRDEASAQFSHQLAGHERALAEALAKREAAEADAARTTEEAQQRSRALLESAQEEATQLVSAARAQAERIRRESERELSAATARRDSITAQLANVRQMLATLGTGVASGLLQVEDDDGDGGDDDPGAEAAEAVADDTAELVAAEVEATA